MKLALRLGRTLQELRNEMSAEELRLWIAFNEISPIGDERSDIQTAIMAAAPLQAQGAKISAVDMLPTWVEQQSDLSVEDEIEAGEQMLKASLLSLFKQQHA